MINKQGIYFALGAFILWGIFPLYFKQIEAIPATEIIAHRLIWSFIFGALLLVATGTRGWLVNLLRRPQQILGLFITAVLNSANWLASIWAINNDRILDASLGYYMLPLVGIALSVLVLKEQLSGAQKVAISLVILSVLMQIMLFQQIPWIALVISLSFALYGVIRKLAPVGAVIGLTVESFLLTPIALIWLWLNPHSVSTQLNFWTTASVWWLIGSGLATLLPLICYIKAAQKLAFNLVNMLHYLVPTITFLLGAFYYGEVLDWYRLASFSLIWLAILIYSWSVLRPHK